MPKSLRSCSAYWNKKTESARVRRSNWSDLGLRSDHDHCALREYAWPAMFMHQSILYSNIYSEVWLNCKKWTHWQTVACLTYCSKHCCLFSIQSAISIQCSRRSLGVTQQLAVLELELELELDAKLKFKSASRGIHREQTSFWIVISKVFASLLPIWFTSASTAAAERVHIGIQSVTAVCRNPHADSLRVSANFLPDDFLSAAFLSAAFLSAARVTTTSFRFRDLPAMTRSSDHIGSLL